MSPEAIEEFRADVREYRGRRTFSAQMAMKSLISLAADVPELAAVLAEEDRP